MPVLVDLFSSVHI